MILFWVVGSGPVRSGQARSDDGNSDNRANSVQLELELGLSLAISNTGKESQSRILSPRYMDFIDQTEAALVVAGLQLPVIC